MTESTLKVTAKANKFFFRFASFLCLYLLGYAYARATIFHTVEHYVGAEGKGGPRQDYITRKDLPAGTGWEYQLFLPAIKIEEKVINHFHNQQFFT